MENAKRWVLNTMFQGQPKVTDFKLIEENGPDIKDDEVLVKAQFLSVDPYMRISGIGGHYLIPGETIGGEQVAKATAYIAFLQRCNPQPGEIVLVNAAAGAVGSIIGQMAKIKGCTVIGSAGTEAKCEWLKELGFDEVFNYKTANLAEILTKTAPDGIDCFVDGVGGDYTVEVVKRMRSNGRVVIIGFISLYNTDSYVETGPLPYVDILAKEIKIDGCNILNWREKWPSAFTQIMKWIKEGKLKYRETVTEGFENMPHAFIGLFTGSNTGKAIVKV